MSNQLLESLQEELDKALPGRHREMLVHLAHHMVNPNYEAQGIKAVVEHLLTHGTHTADLLAALIRCEWKSLKVMLPDIEKLDEQTQAHRLRGMIERFTLIQKALVSVNEEAEQNMVMQQNSSRVLKAAEKGWKASGFVTLYNLFEEVPIRADAKVSQWDGNVLHTRVTPELGRVFSIDTEMRHAYIDSPLDGFRLKVSIDRVRGSSLQLRVVKIDASEVSRRQRIRVALVVQKPVQMVAEFPGAEQLPVFRAKLADFSTSGMGLIAMDDFPFVPGEKLRCKTQIGEVQVNHVGEIVWAKSLLEGGRFGMKMAYDNPIQRQLNSEILAMQRSKIERISQMGMPHTLLSKS